ncbi:MAG: transposase [Chitinispirillaceae bacterium]|nr:transposase [Chitinispirillaceae bacterium]
MKTKEITTRKKYDAEFKRNAVELVLAGKRPCRAVERDLGIPQGILHRWIKEYKANPKGSFPGLGHKKPEVVSIDPSLLSLKQEIDELRLERDILKKALAIVSKEPARCIHSLVR